MDLKGVEIFRVGRWNDLRTFTEDDLQAMEDSFAELRLAGRAPLKLGHNDEQPLTDGQPALGWVERVWRDGEVLKADFTGMPRAVHEAVRAGLYKHVSVELLRDVMAGNKEYPWVLSAVALLGADIPAVSGLRDLQQLTMARRVRFASGTRMTFTTGGKDAMDEVEKLKAKIAAQEQQLVQQAQDSDIEVGRCIPAERERFNKRYGKTGTLTDWKDWVRTAQRPPAHMTRQGGNGRVHDSHADTMPEGDKPDAEMVTLTRAEMKADPQLTYFAANRIVMKKYPELADRYRHMPGVRE